ncbi:MAG: 5-formyltetrahydrofolate cyclo-ligase [Bdellovibrionales bacterium]
MAQQELKQNLRDVFRQKRTAQPRSSVTSSLCELLREIRSEKALWLSYRASQSEANPQEGVDQLGGRWAYPKVFGPSLKFYVPHSEDSWSQGPWGLLEPDPAKSDEVSVNDAEGALIPGLAFDKNGTRLGSGKGFYDRALETFKGYRVGVAYESQLSLEDLPRESHDVPMQFVVTEKRVMRLPKG